MTTRHSILWGQANGRLKIESLVDASRVKGICVIRGGNREAFLATKGFENLVPVEAPGQCLNMLLAGRIELIFMSSLEVASLATMHNTSKTKLVPLYKVFSNKSYIAMSKNGTSAQTVKQWQDTTQAMKDDGTFSRIANKWSDYILKHYAMPTYVKNNVLIFEQKR
ncbi:amino acid ABC transporter substrate-binding protein [Pseudoalteromonas sp. JBTF-M23]|uniref:Amino acid ABC transporter substrate-binding protein n=1 Tax=Pseudoalteromonas caenipelagi TaxID=2726988 RepID=A0A849V838_9GAMM|nr:amino acid ABC transporter substrate-binding protein [Pseudoalteromonas caenipelagi]